MSKTVSPTQKPNRLKRLLLLLVAVAAVWGVTTTVRMMMPPSPLTLARESIEAGQLDVAVEQYLKHLEQQPEDWNARLELGLVLATFDRPRALSELRMIPPDTEAYLEACKQITMICLASGRDQEAEQAMLAIEAASPDDWSVRLNLAEFYFREGQPSDALPYARRSSELNPQHKRTHFLIAELMDELQRPSEMIDPLRKVIDLDLDDYAAHLNLSYAYCESGQAASCQEEAEWCLARNPADVNALRFLAMALREQGNREDALATIEQALTLDPYDLECRLVQAELLLFERRAEDAFKNLEPLYEHHQRDRRLAALLARAAAATGREQQAAGFRQQVQKLSER